MKNGLKIRIYPTKEQEKQLLEWCKIYHDMWNFLVAKYKDKLPNISKNSIKSYNAINLMNDFNTVIPERIVRAVIQSYVWSVKKFYDKKGNVPKFHKYNPNKQSFYLIDKVYQIINYSIAMPYVGRDSKNRKNRIMIDQKDLMKSCINEIHDPHFTYYKNKWFLSGWYDKPDVIKSQTKDFVGLDWGIKNFMTTSEGEYINYPKSVLREYQRIKKLQSIMDKKKKGSNNRKKILIKLQKAYQRLENIKNNFIEKETTKLCKENNIAIEDVTGFVTSKRFVRRQNIISPHPRFTKKLEWKCEKFGSYFIKVDPAYTSQTCCKCGQLHKLTLKNRVMICDCGNILDRDINAAINIKNRAIALMVDCHNQ